MESEPALPAQFRLLNARVDRRRRLLWVDGRRVALSTLTFDLLLALAESSAVLSSEDLIRRVWHGRVVSDDTVTQRIKLLRQALGDDSRQPRFIETVRGRGYRLLPTLQPDLLPEADSIDSPDPASGGSPDSPSRSRLWLVTLTAALLVIGLLWRQQSPIPAESVDSPGITTPSAPVAGDYLARAWQHLGQHQVADYRSARRLFTEALSHDPENAEAMAGLSMALTQGVTKFEQPHNDLIEAEALAERSIDASPNRHHGHLALASALDAAGQVQPAIDAYQDTLEIDPRHPGAMASLAYLYQVRGRLVEALRMNLTLAQRGHQLPYLELQMGQTLHLLGFDDVAGGWLQRTEALQPDNVFAAATLARHAMVTGDRGVAMQVLTDALDRGVSYPEVSVLQGMIHWLDDDLPAARAAFERAAGSKAHPHSRPQVALALMDADRARQQVLVQQIRGAIDAGDTWPENYLMLAELHTGLADHHSALAALERLHQAGFLNYRWLNLLPTLKDLRQHPDYRQRLQQMRADVREQRTQVIESDWAALGLLLSAAPPEE